MRILGIILIILTVMMAIFGVSLFSYYGELNATINKIGEYSFILWLPILISGIIIRSVTSKKQT